jgi:ethanolamine utilization protein EutA (predicted chaperonin)
MKKILMLLTMLVGALTAQAEDYTYLTFETTDGAKASVSVASDVTLTISGTTLTVGSQSFTLTNLSKMYFSNTDETTGIEEITSATLDEATDIYDLQGHKVSKDQMRRGVYIVKTNSRTYKMVVR